MRTAAYLVYLHDAATGEARAGAAAGAAIAAAEADGAGPGAAAAAGAAAATAALTSLNAARASAAAELIPLLAWLPARAFTPAALAAATEAWQWLCGPGMVRWRSRVSRALSPRRN
jgi:hypothetical protein